MMELDEIGEYMSHPVLRIDADATVQDAAILMNGNNVGCLIVEKYGEDVGIVTEKDFTQKVLSKGKNTEEVLVSEVMTSPILSMDRYLPIEQANQFMHDNQIRHLAVTESDKIVGILSIKDLVRYYSRDFRVQQE